MYRYLGKNPQVLRRENILLQSLNLVKLFITKIDINSIASYRFLLYFIFLLA